MYTPRRICMLAARLDALNWATAANKARRGQDRHGVTSATCVIFPYLGRHHGCVSGVLGVAARQTIYIYIYIIWESVVVPGASGKKRVLLRWRDVVFAGRRACVTGIGDGAGECNSNRDGRGRELFRSHELQGARYSGEQHARVEVITRSLVNAELFSVGDRLRECPCFFIPTYDVEEVRWYGLDSSAD